MHPLDLFVIVAYFACVAAIGWWSSRRSRESTSDYFLAGRDIGWVAVGASLFATNISAEHFIGLAGSGAASGLAVGQFEWLACIILLILGWAFVPMYLSGGVFTMPEFLERRYNRACRSYLSAVSLVAYVFTKISVAVYAGALVLKTILGWDIWLGAIALIVSTGVYTIFGGLHAVIYTDYFQAGVLILGGFVLTGLGLSQAGGFAELTAKLPASYFSVWHGADHPDFPWTGIVFGAPILGIWYWCTDQVIVQRTLASRTLSDARRATVFAGILKILPVFILVLPGLAGRVLYPDVKPDQMYATMVQNLLPPGVKGVVVAALLSALMSSLSSVFNSSSTLFVMDFYKSWHPEASEARLVRAGQIVTLVLVLSGLAWLPLLGLMSEQIYLYLQSVQAYISPPIAAAFVLGLLWRRANGQGAFASLLAGALLGGARFIAEVLVKTGTSSHPALVALAGVNFLHFAAGLFAVSCAVLVAVSLATAPPAEEKLAIISAGRKADLGEDPAAARIDAVFAAGLLLVLGLLWLYFSPLVWK